MKSTLREPSDLIRRLIEQKAEDSVGLRNCLLKIAGGISEESFLMFCAQTPAGRKLQETFLAWSRTKPRDASRGEQNWKMFALLQARQYAMRKECLLPVSCQIPVKRLEVWVERHRTGVERLGMTACVLGRMGIEPYAGQFKERACGGCHRVECTHHRRNGSSGLIRLRVRVEEDNAPPRVRIAV